MITTCQFLRIYTEAIENIEDEIIKELQKVDVDFEYTQDEVLESLEEIGNWKNITNSIITALCCIAESLVLEKYPEARVDWFVNSYDSSFSINNIEELLEDEEKEEDGK